MVSRTITVIIPFLGLNLLWPCFIRISQNCHPNAFKHLGYQWNISWVYIVLISRILYLSHRHFPYEIFNQTNEFNPEEQTHFGLKLSFLISLCVCNLHKPAAQRYYFWTHFVMEDFTWVLFSIIIIILVINNNDLYSSLRWHCYFKTRDIKLDLELKSANVTARGESRERN